MEMKNNIFGLKITPVDFWHRHFLVYDLNFHKVGTCDLVRGVWHFNLVDSSESFIGFSRDDAVLSWYKSSGCNAFTGPKFPIVLPDDSENR